MLRVHVEAQAIRHDDGLGALVDAKFCQDSGHVDANRLFCDDEFIGYRPVGKSFGDDE